MVKVLCGRFLLLLRNVCEFNYAHVCACKRVLLSVCISSSYVVIVCELVSKEHAGHTGGGLSWNELY